MPNFPTQLHGKIIEALATKLLELPRRQQWYHQPSTPCTTKALLAQTTGISDPTEAYSNMQSSFSNGKQTRERVTNPSKAEDLSTEGALVDPSSNNDRHPASQELLAMKKNMQSGPSDKVSTHDATAAFCAKKDSEAVVI